MFKSIQIKKAWSIRKAAAEKFNCKVTEISWAACLKIASCPAAGFVRFDSRNWGFAGDKGTWARVNEDGSITVKKAAKGTISSAYIAELSAYCSANGIDWDAIHCGQSITK